MLTLRIKNGEKVTIHNPDGTTTELLIKVNEGNAVKLGIRAPKEYGVKRDGIKKDGLREEAPGHARAIESAEGCPEEDGADAAGGGSETEIVG